MLDWLARRIFGDTRSTPQPFPPDEARATVCCNCGEGLYYLDLIGVVVEMRPSLRFCCDCCCEEWIDQHFFPTPAPPAHPTR